LIKSQLGGSTVNQLGRSTVNHNLHLLRVVKKAVLNVNEMSSKKKQNRHTVFCTVNLITRKSTT